MVTSEKELLEYALKMAGGAEAVRQSFVKDRLMKSIGGGATVGSIIAAATAEGWIDTLNSVKFSDLLGMTKGSKAKSSRISKEGKEELRTAVLKHLEANPWISKGKIAEATSFDAVKVGVQLRVLKVEGLIKSHGEKGAMTYALKGERTKA